MGVGGRPLAGIGVLGASGDSYPDKCDSKIEGRPEEAHPFISLFFFISIFYHVTKAGSKIRPGSWLITRCVWMPACVCVCVCKGPP